MLGLVQPSVSPHTTSTSKEHLDQLRATLAEAKAMVGDSDDGGDDAADAREKLFKRYGSEALVQKAEFLAESAAKVAEKNGTAAPGAPDKAARQVTRTAAHDGAVRDAMDAMAGPTTHQHERLRLYAKCTVEKHEKFLDMLLQQRQEQQEPPQFWRNGRETVAQPPLSARHGR